MQILAKPTVDWVKTGINLQLIRNDNLKLRRYVCFSIKHQSGSCDGECDSCLYEMDKSISRLELASVFNVSESVIYNWEKGKTPPSVEDLTFYCMMAGVSLEDILVFE